MITLDVVFIIILSYTNMTDTKGKMYLFYFSEYHRFQGKGTVSVRFGKFPKQLPLKTFQNVRLFLFYFVLMYGQNFYRY